MPQGRPQLLALAHLTPWSHFPRLWFSTAALRPWLPLISPTQVHPGRLPPPCAGTSQAHAPCNSLLPPTPGGHLPLPVLSDPARLQSPCVLGAPNLISLNLMVATRVSLVLTADALDKAQGHIWDTEWLMMLPLRGTLRGCKEDIEAKYLPFSYLTDGGN